MTMMRLIRIKAKYKTTSRSAFDKKDKHDSTVEDPTDVDYERSELNDEPKAKRRKSEIGWLVVLSPFEQ